MLLRGTDEVLLLDEPDNFLDVPGKRWLERRLLESPKTVLYVSHDRELLANTADRVVAVEGGSAWTHAGSFASWHEARAARHEQLDEQRRRWDEEHAKLKELVRMYQSKASHNSDMATRLQAARTRLAKFEQAGPPPIPPREQNIRMRLDGGRTGKRAVVCEQLELDGLTSPF
ncbi:MAG TPA: ABC transporter ATP-binding protein, partial [Actinocrinis sp.]|nr:ABC transporter ATP-binding protein [Actinocrinis sp.]